MKWKQISHSPSSLSLSLSLHCESKLTKEVSQKKAPKSCEKTSLENHQSFLPLTFFWSSSASVYGWPTFDGFFTRPCSYSTIFPSIDGTAGIFVYIYWIVRSANFIVSGPYQPPYAWVNHWFEYSYGDYGNQTPAPSSASERLILRSSGTIWCWKEQDGVKNSPSLIILRSS